MKNSPYTSEQTERETNKQRFSKRLHVDLQWVLKLFLEKYWLVLHKMLSPITSLLSLQPILKHFKKWEKKKKNLRREQENFGGI